MSECDKTYEGHDSYEARRMIVIDNERLRNELTTLRTQLAEAKADNARLREALELLLEVYCSLVDSGDCGCWESKDDECVIKARQALTPTEPSK